MIWKMATMAALAVAKDFYTILSVDGGAIKGLIPGIVLEKIELYAEEYARKKGYQVPHHIDHTGKVREDRIHLADIFDSFAGTSAGSILTGGLATPNPNNKTAPKFYSDKLINIFSTKGG